ncbi:NAD(P)-dependent oxidoreductase [Arthrobacter sp. Marseille-P9274]|uniref:NAD(P)-dependent oxidoreductase n=1 Tax=Arthrobacter sp. Marseille-P9274 TaxID=2866572 RepID=UPI0021C9FC0E|nr:NAD(P)-dependent oxidoreductase [Arthrobacter sp. Marseille-P9274]
MSEVAKPRIGFIGLGNMGTPMSGRLVEAGFSVTGTDLAEENRDRLARAGGTAVETAAQVAAASDVLILMLPNSAIVESVLLDDGVAAALPASAVIVDMSSSEPLRTRALAERLAAQGLAQLVDAPVSGGVGGAEKGTLTIMAGGETETIESLSPVLSVLGRVRHTGAVGSGHALKALNNLLSATHLLATSEAMVAGQEFGLDSQTMLEVFNSSSGRSGSTENKWPNFVLTGGYNSGFGLGLMLKDMRIATQLAADIKQPSVLGSYAVELWSKAAAELEPTADHTEIARWAGHNG